MAMSSRTSNHHQYYNKQTVFILVSGIPYKENMRSMGPSDTPRFQRVSNITVAGFKAQCGQGENKTK